jgi:hypothetical protein
MQRRHYFLFGVWKLIQEVIIYYYRYFNLRNRQLCRNILQLVYMSLLRILVLDREN